MRPGLQTLSLALSLAVLSAQNLSAQPPLDPPPNVELQDVTAVGNDLAATFAWSSDGAAPSSGAWLRLFDAEGQNTGTISITPAYGSQTVWIPGGAAPRASDGGTWPLTRYIQIVTDSTHEIVIENQLSVYASGPAQIMYPLWPWPFATGRQCYLHVVSLTCDDPEDNNGDEPYLVISGFGLWRGPRDVRGVRTMPINQVYLLCDDCQNIKKTTKLELYDQDDPGFPLFDPDDHLGTQNVSGCSTVPLKTVKFSGSNYTYWLRYRVACFEDICQ